MDKQGVVHIYNGVYSAIKKNGIMLFTPIWIGSRDHHTEWNKSESEGEIPYDIPYMYNLKNDTNKLKKHGGQG